jgi:hypothetical protein
MSVCSYHRAESNSGETRDTVIGWPRRWAINPEYKALRQPAYMKTHLQSRAKVFDIYRGTPCISKTSRLNFHLLEAVLDSLNGHLV